MKPGNSSAHGSGPPIGNRVGGAGGSPHTPWGFGPQEKDLSPIISDWGFPIDNNALQHTTPLESLPAGRYSISHYAIVPGEAQPRGTYPLAITLPGRGGQSPADGIRLLIPQKSGNWECDLAFTATSDFSFFEATKRQTILLTTQNHDSATKPYHRRSGSIFDLGEINPLYAGQYIIAFEEGRNRHPLGDLGHKDLVIHLSRLDDETTCPFPEPCH